MRESQHRNHVWSHNTETEVLCCTAGGRVTGVDSIAEMILELHLSVDAGKGFEGEMARLSGYSRCPGSFLKAKALSSPAELAFAWGFWQSVMQQPI